MDKVRKDTERETGTREKVRKIFFHLHSQQELVNKLECVFNDLTHVFRHTLRHDEAADFPSVDLSFQDKLCSSSECTLYAALSDNLYNQK